MDTLERFDGMAVDLTDAKFSGSFDTDGASQVDTEGYFVVRVRTKGASFAETKSGDLKRTDIHSVLEACRIPDDKGLQLMASATAQLSIFGNSDDDDDDDDDEA